MLLQRNHYWLNYFSCFSALFTKRFKWYSWHMMMRIFKFHLLMTCLIYSRVSLILLFSSSFCHMKFYFFIIWRRELSLNWTSCIMGSNTSESHLIYIYHNAMIKAAGVFHKLIQCINIGNWFETWELFRINLLYFSSHGDDEDWDECSILLLKLFFFLTFYVDFYWNSNFKISNSNATRKELSRKLEYIKALGILKKKYQKNS